MMVKVTQEAERWYQSLPREQFDLFLQCVRDAEKRGARLALEAAAAISETETDYTTVTPFVHRERLTAAIRALSPAKIVGEG